MNNQLEFTEQNNPSSNINNKNIITSIQTILEFGKIGNGAFITSIIKTEDNRIAIGYSNGSISINSLNISENKWTKDIHKHKAHNEEIFALVNLSNKRLLSGETNIIVVWTFDANTITNVKTIQCKMLSINKIISLNEQTFATCSWDGGVRLWNDSTYNQITILQHEHSIQTIILLEQKNILVTGSIHSSTGIGFWNIDSYEKIKAITGYAVDLPNATIELADGNVACSSKNHPHPIIIISCITFEIIKEIKLDGIMIGNFPMCTFDGHSFICANKNKVVQISSVDYSVMFVGEGKGFKNNWGIIVPYEKDCFLIESGEYVSIIKVNID